MFVHADAGVLDFEDEVGTAARTVSGTQETQRDAALDRELDRVARKVEQDLANARLVADDRARDGGRNLGHDFEVLVEGARREQFGNAFDDGARIEGVPRRA